MWRTMHSPSEPWECPVKVLVTEEEFHHSDCLQGNPTWSLQEEQNCVSMYSSTCSSTMSQLFSHSEIWSVCSIPCRFLLSFCLLVVQNTVFRQSDKYTWKDENSLVNNHQPLNASKFIELCSVLVPRFRQVQISNTNAVRIVTEWWNAGSKLGNETMCILWSFPSVGTFHCRPVHNRHTFWVSSLSHSIYLSRMMLQLNILDKCCRSCKYSF